jgi:hypothetical protein
MTLMTSFFADMVNFANIAIILSNLIRFVHIGYTFTYWLMTPGDLYHDLGEPDDLFADTYNFDVYAILQFFA